MTRSRLLNKFRQERTISSHVAYEKQRNTCVKKLLRKTKKHIFNNLDIKHVIDNKQFWKTLKPRLTDKTLRDDKITLIENEKVVSDEKVLVSIFNECFSNVVSNLDNQRLPNITLHLDLVLYAIKQFETTKVYLK